MSSRATSRSHSAKSSVGGRGLHELNQLYHGLECEWVESEENSAWSGWGSSNQAMSGWGSRAVTPSNPGHEGKGASVVEIMNQRCRFRKLPSSHAVTRRKPSLVARCWSRLEPSQHSLPL